MSPSPLGTGKPQMSKDRASKKYALEQGLNVDIDNLCKDCRTAKPLGTRQTSRDYTGHHQNEMFRAEVTRVRENAGFIPASRALRFAA